jgi:TonB-dependent receptor
MRYQLLHAALFGGVATGAVLASAATAQTAPEPAAAPVEAGQTAPAQDEAASEPDIVVTGYRASLRASQAAKREAASVVEAITPEDLGKFSDNSIADELQRVPGVQIDRNNGGRAGDRVSIRGLGSNFVTAMVNGRTPGSYGQEGLINLRSFPIDTMPSEVLSGVLVYKTATADHVESGLGGAVDLQTLRPLDYKPRDGGTLFGTLTGRVGKNTGTDRVGKGVSGIIGGKFAGDTLGVYVAALANENPYYNDFLEIRPQINTVNVRGGNGTVSRQQVIFPSYPDYGRVRRIEKRLGGSAGVQWKPTDALEVNLDYTYSRFNRPDNRDYSTLQMDGGNILSGVFEPGGITIRDGAVTGLDFTKYTPAAGSTATSAIPYNQPLPLYYDNFATTQIGGLNVKWKQDRLTVSGDVSLNRMRSLQDLYILYGNNIYYPNYTGVNYSAGDGKGPGSFNVGAPDFTDRSRFGLNSVFQRFIQNHTDGKAARGDVGYELSDEVTLKAGARWSQSTVDVRSASYFSDAITAAQSSQLVPVLFPGSVDTLFPGRTIGVNAQPTQDPRAASRVLPTLVPALTPNILTGNFANAINARGPWGLDAKRSFRVKETTTALYGQAEDKGQWGTIAFEANAGLRGSARRRTRRRSRPRPSSTPTVSRPARRRRPRSARATITGRCCPRRT